MDLHVTDVYAYGVASGVAATMLLAGIRDLYSQGPCRYCLRPAIGHYVLTVESDDRRRSVGLRLRHCRAHADLAMAEFAKLPKFADVDAASAAFKALPKRGRFPAHPEQTATQAG